MVASNAPQRVRWMLLVGAIAIGVLLAPSGVVAQQATVTTDAPETASPGETITVSVTLTNAKSSQENYIADVSLPDRWTVESHTDDGGTWNGGDVKWLWQNIPANSSVTPSLTVTVPAETTGGSVAIATTAKSAAGTEDTATHTVDLASSDEDSESGGGSSGGTGDTGTDTTQADSQTDGEPAGSEESQAAAGSEPTESNTRTVHEIEDANPDQPGTTVDTSETTTVEQVSFDSDSIDGELEISAYEDIPQEVSAEISENIRGDIAATDDSNSGSGETTEDSQSEGNPGSEPGDSNAGQPESQDSGEISIVTVADISPPPDASDMDASVTFTVSREKLRSPEEAVITHKRDTDWHRLQTEVVSSTDESVTLEANTESFSLFAVVEDPNTELATTDQPSDDESLSDRLSTFHLTSLLFALIAVVLLKRYRM